MSNATYELINDGATTDFTDRVKAKTAFEDAVKLGGESNIILREIKIIGQAEPGMRVQIKPRAERKAPVSA